MRYDYEDMQRIGKMKGWKKWINALKYLFVDYEELERRLQDERDK